MKMKGMMQRQGTNGVVYWLVFVGAIAFSSIPIAVAVIWYCTANITMYDDIIYPTLMAMFAVLLSLIGGEYLVKNAIRRLKGELE